MSALSSHLDMLLQQIDSFGLQPPSGEVRILEISQIRRVSADGTYHVQRNELRNPWTTRVGSMSCWRRVTPGSICPVVERMMAY